MISLIKNELIKQFYTRLNFIAIALLISIAVLLGLFTSVTQEQNVINIDKGNWKTSVNNNIKKLEKENDELLGKSNNFKDEIRLAENTETIRKLNFHLSKNIIPTNGLNSVEIFQSITIGFGLAGILALVISSSILTSEFSNNTIKSLLISPLPRYYIFLSKYITALMYTIFYFLIIFIVAMLYSMIAGQISSYNETVLTIPDYAHSQNNYVVVNFWMYIIGFLGIMVFKAFTIMSICFGLSCIINNVSLTLSISIFLYLLGDKLNNFLFKESILKKISILSHWDLSVFSKYSIARPILDGLSIYTSILIVLIYVFFILLFTIIKFEKKDIL